MQTKPHKHIEPGCFYCDNDHDPDITCRSIAACLQQEMEPKPESQPAKPEFLRDASGMVVGIRFK